MNLRWVFSLILAVIVTIATALTVIYAVGAWMQFTLRFPIAPEWLEVLDLTLLVALFCLATRLLYFRWKARRARTEG